MSNLFSLEEPGPPPHGGIFDGLGKKIRALPYIKVQGSEAQGSEVQGSEVNPERGTLNGRLHPSEVR